MSFDQGAGIGRRGIGRDAQVGGERLFAVEIRLAQRGLLVDLGFARDDRRRQEKMRRAARVLLSYSDPFDEEVCLVDFLADLQHYCKTNGYDFDHAVETARNAFEPEK